MPINRHLQIRRHLQTCRHLSVWMILCFLLLLQAFYFSWQLLAPSNFLFPLWYDVMKIDRAIMQYAPLNQYKKDFVQTNRAEHHRLFAEITQAVQGRVEQRQTHLSTLSYQNPQGKIIDTLLREPEIQHLLDVGILIDDFKKVSLFSILISAALLILLHKNRWRFPDIKILGASFAGLITVVIGMIWILGPVKVFYQLHLWVFPPQHQWFFYYQESLMTTLMQAPMLFGYIASTWVALAITFFSIALSGLAYGFGVFHNSFRR